MPNGACYGTCRMVLGMDEVDVIFDKEHELFILQIEKGNEADHGRHRGEQWKGSLRKKDKELKLWQH